MDIKAAIIADTEKGTALFFAEYGEKLYNIAFLMCHSEADAEDLVMRTFENAVRKIAQYDASKPVFPWLCGILVNFYRMDLRGKARNALDFMDPLPEPDSGSPGPGDTLSLMEDAAAVRAAVAALPPRYRVIVCLRFYADMTVPQIATRLSAPEGTVKRLLHEAKALIRRELVRTIRPVRA